MQRAVFLMLVLAAVSLCAPLQVAVLKFKSPASLSEDEVGTINDRFETELNRTGAFTVLERREMDAILQEQGFQSTGACDLGNCEVKIGQLLGVERVITGSVGKVGDVFSMNLKMLDVTTGRIVASDVVDVEGGLQQVLTKGCKQVAQSFAKMASVDGPVKQASVPEIGSNSGSGSLTWLWWTLGGVAIVGGGTAAVMLLTGDEEAGTQHNVNRTVP